MKRSSKGHHLTTAKESIIRGEMKYREFGSSACDLSCLALGGNIFGHFCDKRATAKIIHAAQDLGINLIDTADVYSNGLSEEFIGLALEAKRSDWVIATKVGVQSDENPGGKGRKDYIFRQVEHSLRRLRTDYIDIYQMHHFDPETPITETLEALDLLLKQGKVRFIGASNFSGRQLEMFTQMADSLGTKALYSTQHQYNLFNREIEEDVIPVSKEARIGVFAYGVLARGILAGRYRLGQPLPKESRASTSGRVRADLTKPVLEVVERLIAFAQSREKSIAHVALSWALRLPEITSVIIGVRSIAQLKANVEGTSWRLSDDELFEIDTIIEGGRER